MKELKGYAPAADGYLAARMVHAPHREMPPEFAQITHRRRFDWLHTSVMPTCRAK